MAETEGRSFRAGRAVLTLPLTAWQAGDVHFEPDIPEKRAAAERLAMGDVTRLTVRFRERFWPDDLAFVFSLGDTFPTWWSRYPDNAPLLTGWTAGPGAECLVGLPREAIVSRALESLSRLFSLPRAELELMLVSNYTYDWCADAFSRGAYSYVPAGAMDAPAELARPVEGVLFFAGEATDTAGRNGTVHGAIASGVRAARELLAARVGSRG